MALRCLKRQFLVRRPQVLLGLFVSQTAHLGRSIYSVIIGYPFRLLVVRKTHFGCFIEDQTSGWRDIVWAKSAARM